MKSKKYKCPNCGREMSNIRYNDKAFSVGVTVKCNKCGQIVEIIIKNENFLQYNVDNR